MPKRLIGFYRKGERMMEDCRDMRWLLGAKRGGGGKLVMEASEWREI